MTRKQRSTVAVATTILSLAGGGGVAWACTGFRRPRLERDHRDHHDDEHDRDDRDDRHDRDDDVGERHD
jgi:hypothetical protein